MITIQPRADVTRRRGGKRIVGQERERAAIVVQKFPDEMQRPWVFGGGRHGREPDLPIDSRLIRRNKRRSPVEIARFGFEFVFLPFSVAIDQSISGSLENNFLKLFTIASERSVCFYLIERIVCGIH